MKKSNVIIENDNAENNVALIRKIYESFEALEETLGMLKLEEPLFITYIAKKSFADVIFNGQKNQNKTTKKTNH